jgi:hypothetical protein
VFVYGGTGNPDYAGAEYVSASTSSTATGSTLVLTLNSLSGYKADPATGLAAIALDATGNTMLLAGGSCYQPTLPPLTPCTIDLTCTGMSCSPNQWGQALPYALSSPSLFSIANGAFIIVGDDSTGTTHMFELTTSATTEILLKVPRQGARAAQIETGAIVIVGGGSATPESFVP